MNTTDQLVKLRTWGTKQAASQYAKLRPSTEGFRVLNLSRMSSLEIGADLSPTL